MKIISPLSGTILCYTEDDIQQNRTVLSCVIEAPAGHSISVNGIPCSYEEQVYRAAVPVEQATLTLCAKDHTDGSQESVTVQRILIKNKIYRLSIDDGIWFLQDIANNQERYGSIFENPYLSMLRRLHQEYGTKFHINIYYTCPEHGGFTLTQLSDKFKAEWLSVKDWLVLSFHAKANLPNYPYSQADYQTVHADCSAVMDEIQRFAGYRSAVTTLHFAEATEEGIKGLYDCGVRALLGDYSLNSKGDIQLCYFASQEEFDTVRKHCFWKNPKTDMIMFPCDTVLNCYPPNGICQELDWYADKYPNRPFMDILIHEQYFYEDYTSNGRSYHLADYEERMRAGIEWCRAHGYTPGLVSDILDFEKLKKK